MTDQPPTIDEMIDRVLTPYAVRLLGFVCDALTLTDEQRSQLVALVERPSCDTWDDAHSMCLTEDGTSLFTAITRTDRGGRRPRRGLSPSTRWAGYYPTTMTVLLALKRTAYLSTQIAPEGETP